MELNTSWNNTDVTVTFEATDELSGIASVTEPITVTTEGEDQYVGGEAVDIADNQATTYAIVNLDKTPPQTTAVVEPLANEYGWNNSFPVNITFNATDNLSGIAYTTEPVSLSSEGIYTIDYYSIDFADNIEPTKTTTIKIDTTPPITEYTLSENPNQYGWINKLPLTISFSATDPLLSDGNPPSGVAFITPDKTIENEGVHTIDSVSYTHLTLPTN